MKVTFGQLPWGQLGQTDAANSQVVLDPTAAGYGWFVDSTPGQDEEFSGGTAAAGSPAFGHMDLLSAVLIQFAKLAGLDLVAPGLRTQTLAAGQRNLAVLNVASSMNASPTDGAQAAAGQQTGSDGPLTMTLPNTTAGVQPLTATPPTTTTTTTPTTGFATPRSNSSTGSGFPSPLTNDTTQSGIGSPLSGTATQSGFATPLTVSATQPGFATPFSMSLATANGTASGQTASGFGNLPTGL